MTDILHLHSMFRIKILLKRKDNVHMINIALDLMDTGLFPCPDLWRDVIKNFYSILLGPFGNSQIESRVIDQHQCIRFEIQNILFTKFDVSEDCSQVHYYLNKTHESKISNMLCRFSAHLFHFVSSPKSEIDSVF